jgi:hypothetical protein
MDTDEDGSDVELSPDGGLVHVGHGWLHLAYTSPLDYYKL